MGLELGGHTLGHPGIAPGTDGIEYSVVVPVFNEEVNLGTLVERVAPVLDATGEAYEILFVDDGSTDSTPSILRDLCAANPRVRAVRLSRNFGQEAAVQAAYLYARGRWLVQLDGDLQNPPEEIPTLLALKGDNYDIVFGVRTGRQDSWFRRFASRSMRWTTTRLLRIALPEDISTFRLMRASTAKLLASFPERRKFLSALACWIGAKHISVPVRHEARARGKTKYNIAKLVSHTFDLVVGFSSRPLKLVGVVGLVLVALSVVVVIAAFVSHIALQDHLGTATIIATVLFTGGVQLMGMSLMGGYVGRLFAETLARPVFIVAECLGTYPGAAACANCSPAASANDASRAEPT